MTRFSFQTTRRELLAPLAALFAAALLAPMAQAQTNGELRIGYQKSASLFVLQKAQGTLEKRLDFTTTPVSTVMSHNPRTIAPDALAAEVVQVMEQHNINQMLVVDAGNKLVGALNVHDLLRAKVI